MVRLNLKFEVLRPLFARSGNQCAFLGCTQLMVNSKNQFIGNVCHIEVASSGGPRYNPNQTDEERRSYDNLLLLCYPHHVESNDESDYPIDRLKKIKYDHESKFEKNPFTIDDTVLHKITNEMDLFWNQIEKLNTLEHSMKEFAAEINAKGSFFDIMESCRQNVKYLQDFFDTFRETEKNKHTNWELHYIGVPNRMDRLRIDLIHIEIKYLEEYLKINSQDVDARKKLDLLKIDFQNIAKDSVVID